MKNKAQFDFFNIDLDNVRFVTVKSSPAIQELSSPQLYVDDAVDESTRVGNKRMKNFNNNFSHSISQITSFSEPTDDSHVLAQSYVDSLPENDWK